jgi:hypothetical protein
MIGVTSVVNPDEWLELLLGGPDCFGPFFPIATFHLFHRYEERVWVEVF